MVSRLRKQRVALRFRRREQIKGHVRTIIVRSCVVALIVGFGMGAAAGPDSVVARFLRAHTPQVKVVLSSSLVGLPVTNEISKNPLSLWIPGIARWHEKRICQKYLPVRSLRWEKSWSSNAVTVHFEPRVPLVIWNGQGFDREGVVFAVRPGAWKGLPHATFNANASRSELGRWLTQQSSYYPLWTQVVSIKQDSYGALELTLKTGTVVQWGPPEKELAAKKVQALLRVLDDMHTNSGGTARADLRFFDQGRIIVSSKNVRG